MEEALGTVKSLQFKLEAAEKENKILGITLRQRDAEVKRLRELTRYYWLRGFFCLLTLFFFLKNLYYSLGVLGFFFNPVDYCGFSILVVGGHIS